MMNPFTRRQFFTNGSHLLGGAALTSLLGEAMKRISEERSISALFS